MTKIQVILEDGCLVTCKVIEWMGFNHDVGARTAWVSYNGKEFMAAKFGTWRKWTSSDRTQPLREWIARKLDRAGEGG